MYILQWFQKDIAVVGETSLSVPSIYVIYNICGCIYEIIISFQSELDTLAATLKQLENQKGEAQKRLNDLKAQVIIVGLERSFRLVFSALLLVADS